MLTHRPDRDQEKMFNRRVLLLGAGQALLFAGLGARMYDLQVVKGEAYRLLADDNRINVQLLAPPRGRILDRSGRPLAVNRPNYRVLVVPEQTESVAETLDAIAAYVAIAPDERERILRAVGRSRSFVPVMIAEHLTWDQFATINARGPELPGVLPDVGATRDYLMAEPVSHIVGHVGAVAEEDLTGDPVLELPDFKIGKLGAERQQDLALRGRAGARQVEVNSLGRIIRELDRNEAVPGNDVTLTIDADLQAAIYRRIVGEAAAACVMDVDTGDLLALVSAPGFDPNAFARGLSNTEWQGLLQDERKPLVNKAAAGQYPPGSTFKMVTGLAALTNNAIDPEEKIECRGRIRLGDARFHCWKRGGHGRMNMLDAIKHSCDVYFYEAARRTGIRSLGAMANRFGLGVRHDIGLAGETSGLIPTPEWKRGTFDQPWVQGETLIAGIGQGYVLASPMQLAVMTARIARGGVNVMPRLYRAVGGEEVPVAAVEPIPMPPGAAQLIQAGMFAVSNEERGTAFRARIERRGWEIAGKTGTSQVRRITKAERARGITKNEDLPWRRRDHALFVCYAPFDAPRYAVSVVVEHGGSGSKAAAPIARDVMLETLERDPAMVARVAALEGTSG